MNVEVSCSFCGKRESEVAALVKGPAVFICNECVDTCAAIISERPRAPGLNPVNRLGLPDGDARIGFDRNAWTAKEVKGGLSVSHNDVITPGVAKDFGSYLVTWAAEQGDVLIMEEMWHLLRAGMCGLTAQECNTRIYRKGVEIDDLEAKVEELEQNSPEVLEQRIKKLEERLENAAYEIIQMVPET